MVILLIGNVKLVIQLALHVMDMVHVNNFYFNILIMNSSKDIIIFNKLFF